MKRFLISLLAAATAATSLAQQEVATLGERTEIALNDGWITAFNEKIGAHKGFESARYSTRGWQTVDVPHNWETYEGYRRLAHGNLHGYAWYRKTFTVGKREKGRRYFIFFEGVGSYATVWLNGKQVGKHAGGCTTFTIDVSDALKYDGENLLAVRADHPAGIIDLPWVCGGCFPQTDSPKSSQPVGIFRPVTLVVTGDVRIEPFGIHAWNDEHITKDLAALHADITLRNYSNKPRNVDVAVHLYSPDGEMVDEQHQHIAIDAGDTSTLQFLFSNIVSPMLWTPDKPSLYNLSADITDDDAEEIVDRDSIACGLRTVVWPTERGDDGRFFINGAPLFVNGICEYEHNMGGSHAFTDVQIRARVEQMLGGGFNAFREAQQPHNLRYARYVDSLGMLYWSQFSANTWVDTADFRNNFKTLLREWIVERRSHPSFVLWGLQSESKLPKEFAEECAAIIRELDPTASAQRKIITDNGGTGTDWNVSQNWSGTNGDNPYTYAADLRKQRLNAEYGAWRSIDMHTEGGFKADGALSEDRFTQLLEIKAKQAEDAKKSSCGHFLWLFNSHENPGKMQNGEGLRDIDRIGPVGYQGLFTAWGEPTDAYFMYRARYVPKTSPMVYIPMHTWPDRWTAPGLKDSVVLYSNCDEVELWCDTEMLGRQKRGNGRGRFVFRNVNVASNLLYALGMLQGSDDVQASDAVKLHHLPKSKYAEQMIAGGDVDNITFPREGYSYIYRLNCGGPDYLDVNNNPWKDDVYRSERFAAGSRSWTDEYHHLLPFYGSQRRTHDLIFGSYDGTLFQTFRYGRKHLRFDFPVPPGSYLVELYFVEPWYGRGNMSIDETKGWRVFDVAVNDSTVVKNLDIAAKVGYNRAYKVSVEVNVSAHLLTVWFPRVTSGQAIISAIAIATKNRQLSVGRYSPRLISSLHVANPMQPWEVKAWMDVGDRQYYNRDVAFSELPPRLFSATWLRVPKTIGKCSRCADFMVNDSTELFVGISEKHGPKPAWLNDFTPAKSEVVNSAGEKFTLYTRRYSAGSIVRLGENVAPNAPSYVIAAAYAGSLSEASDMRPIQRLAADSASVADYACLASLDGVKFAKLAKPSCNTLTFSFFANEPDVYALNIRYRNAAKSDTVPLLLQLEDANRTELRADTLHLLPTPDGTFTTYKTSTGKRINAGAYTLRLRALVRKELDVACVEVQ